MTKKLTNEIEEYIKVLQEWNKNIILENKTDLPTETAIKCLTQCANNFKKRIQKLK